MKAMTIGPGRWGSFITWYFHRLGFDTTLYGREDSRYLNEWIEKRSNGTIQLSKEILLTSDLEKVHEQDIISIAVPTQKVRELLKELHDLRVTDKIFILNMKGIEIETGKRISEICKEFLDPSNKVAIWLGPGHPQEFAKEIPNSMVIDSEDQETKEFLVENLSSDLIRFYYGNDVIGNEIGAAYKNIIGICAGILDGLGMSSLKGALTSRGCREVSRLIQALGGKELSAYGLCHLGDYGATVFSEFSNNRMFGEKFAKGEDFEKLAEGYYTCEAIKKLSDNMEVELPINNALYKVLYEDLDISKAMDSLFSRDLKEEFY